MISQSARRCGPPSHHRPPKGLSQDPITPIRGIRMSNGHFPSSCLDRMPRVCSTSRTYCRLSLPEVRRTHKVPANCLPSFESRPPSHDAEPPYRSQKHDFSTFASFEVRRGHLKVAFLQSRAKLIVFILGKSSRKAAFYVPTGLSPTQRPKPRPPFSGHEKHTRKETRQTSQTPSYRPGGLSATTRR